MATSFAILSESSLAYGELAYEVGIGSSTMASQ